MGFVERRYELRIGDDEVIDNRAWNQPADFIPLVLNLELLLLTDRMTAL